MPITKASKSEAQYVNVWKGKEKCMTCVHYSGRGSCTKVIGLTSPGGHCILYKKT
jgi:hypothetical protein